MVGNSLLALGKGCPEHYRLWNLPCRDHSHAFLGCEHGVSPDLVECAVEGAVILVEKQDGPGIPWGLLKNQGTKSTEY